MNRYIIIVALLSLTLCARAQKPKPQPAKDKPPTQKEMEQMMRDAQKAMNELSAEDKRMMDSLGIKMPSFKTMPKATDKQLADAWDEEMRIVPKRNDARIQAALQKTVTSANLSASLTTTHAEVLKVYSDAEKAAAEEAYQYVTRKYAGNALAMANAAVELWMYNKYKAAIYILGKSLIAYPEDLNSINNYAALLTMAGAEEKAVPYLNYLNHSYPNNSTILNNLSQAWFGLGEINRAERYADSTLRFCAWHPQANDLKSRIKESKGHTEEAVSHAKQSIRRGYNRTKEERLRKLGYELNAKDLDYPMKPEPDPMAMGEFSHPDFPVTAATEVALKPEWMEYRKKLEEMTESIRSQLKDAMDRHAEFAKKRLQHDTRVVQASIQAGQPVGQFISVPPFIRKATLKFKEMEKNGIKDRVQEAIKKLANYPSVIAQKKKEYEAAMEKLREEDLEQTGEGKPNKDFCPKYADVVTQYLGATNPEYQQLYDDYLHKTRLLWSEELYWYQFAQWPDEFEITKLTYQANWLGLLHQIKYAETYFFENRPFCENPGDNRRHSKLRNFDDINCNYKSKMNLIFGTIEQNCNKIEAKLEIDIQGVKLLDIGVKTDDTNVRDAQDTWDFFTQSFVSCTIAAGPSIDRHVEFGPLRAEAEVGVKALIEFGKDGITDIGVVAEAEAKVVLAPNAIGGKEAHKGEFIEATMIGVETKFTVNSGFSSEGKGILKPIVNKALGVKNDD